MKDEIAKPLIRQREALTALLEQKKPPRAPQASGAAAPQPQEAPSNLVTINIADLPSVCFRSEASKRVRGVVRYPKERRADLAQLSISFHGSLRPEELTGVEIELHSIPSLFLGICHHDQKIRFGHGCSGRWIFHLWGQCNINVGHSVTSNGMECFVNPGGTLEIGDDCMFATGYIHVGDNHTIFDVNSGMPLNLSDNPSVVLKQHIWFASRATVLADTTVGAGSIIGTGAIVKGNFPRCSLVAGVPARAIKLGVSWTRSNDGSGTDQVLRMLSGDKT